jgi:hypothetical protein
MTGAGVEAMRFAKLPRLEDITLGVMDCAAIFEAAASYAAASQADGKDWCGR